ncbi:MAG: hypothetical protein HY914_16600 [Desulfomonile tiedjei]|nr:hypothetical protein [Desulfomonile tiedjei]
MDLWKRFVIIGLLLSVWAVPAFGWELSLKGETEWRYRFWQRTGDTDIFGQMNSSIVNLGINHLRTYPTPGGSNNRVAPGFGVLAGENCYGAEMTATDMKMGLYPTFKLNPAISISAGVNLTSLGIWSDGQPYYNPIVGVAGGGGGTVAVSQRGWVNSLYVPIGDPQVATNVPNTFVTMQWLKIGMTTPILDFSIGYKQTKFGIGLWKHECMSPSTSFGVTAKCGPFLIEFAPYFSRNLSDWRVVTQRNEGAASQQRQMDRRNYFLAYAGGFVYNNGPLQLAFYSDSYREPSAPRVNGRGLALTIGNPSQDVLRYRLAFAAKYNNGRFFFNGEVDHFNRWRSGRGSQSGAPGVVGTVNAGADDASWLYGTEFGALAGPSKFTFSYARATGDDPSTRKTNEDQMIAETIATGCFLKPWGYLMYYLYGTGDGFNAAGEGNPTNFHHAGARLDYAVAANLNFFSVYSRAWRDQPNAYTLGGDYAVGARPWTNADQLAALRPAVPDSARDIGWEVNVGADWKILENCTWSTTIAWWKPGNWWAYAYPNTAAIYTANGGAVINLAAAPGSAQALAAMTGLNRDINPLLAVETKLLFNF